MRHREDAGAGRSTGTGWPAQLRRHWARRGEALRTQGNTQRQTGSIFHSHARMRTDSAYRTAGRAPGRQERREDSERRAPPHQAPDPTSFREQRERAFAWRRGVVSWTGAGSSEGSRLAARGPEPTLHRQTVGSRGAAAVAQQPERRRDHRSRGGARGLSYGRRSSPPREGRLAAHAAGGLLTRRRPRPRPPWARGSSEGRRRFRRRSCTPQPAGPRGSWRARPAGRGRSPW